MSFTDDQIKELTAPLDRAHVRSRQQGGGGVSYIEAYHAENEANRIFGFDAWDRETELTYLDAAQVDGKWRVYYRAKVRITVRAGEGVVVREGCGFGSGIDRDLGQAHESALKEAESDAEKRALKTFGNPFGQALYDKTQTQVADAALSAGVAAAWCALDQCHDEAALTKFSTDNKAALDAMNEAERAQVRSRYANRMKALGIKPKRAEQKDAA